MAVVCAISGLVPREPVISPRGIVFEKALIEMLLAKSEVCPITATPLVPSDLRGIARESIADKGDATDVLSLIDQLKGCWESLCVESFELKQRLSQSVEELARIREERATCDVLLKQATHERDSVLKHVADLQSQRLSGDYVSK